MHFWWANHKQTFTAEVSGGYIWSPKVEKNGARSQFYDNLTRVTPGDVVFSYADTKIRAIGIVSAPHREAPKPAAFGTTGANWAALGWLVPVDWDVLDVPISPKHHLAEILPLLPESHSPIQANGNGNQKCYLAEISKPLADLLLGYSQVGNVDLADTLAELEGIVSADVCTNELAQSGLDSTEKQQLVRARIGQGLFRQNLLALEKHCRLTGISQPAMLVASHIKPWKDSSNVERLDGHNGLLLSPHVDKLFDRSWISFSDEGEILIINPKALAVMQAWGIDPGKNAGTFTERQKAYLAFHRGKALEGL